VAVGWLYTIQPSSLALALAATHALACSGVPFTEEELTATRGGMTAEGYRWHLIRTLHEGMIDRQSEAETIDAFRRLEIGWTMLFDDAWWAYYNDEKPLGPFPTEAEAARAGLEAWGKETAPGVPS
jgi:hypothetical protein